MLVFSTASIKDSRFVLSTMSQLTLNHALRAYSVCETETGSDQNLRTRFQTVYCMKPK